MKARLFKMCVIASCVSMVLVGCSSTGTKDYKYSADEVKYPVWYVENTNDENALYSVATEYSKDMQFAVDKAMMRAKRELASKFSSYTSSMMKDYASEAGELNNNVLREINRTTKVIVAEVNLIGVKRTDFKVVREKDGYRAWIKLRYAVDDSNKLLLEEIRRNKLLSLKLESSKSFQELEDSVDKIKGRQPKQVASTRPAPTENVVTDGNGVDTRPVE
jgi:hypothetical protein